MSNVRKLVARLNATTAHYNIGRGGIPELPTEDIAGALGMVKDELAREVFCACWWQDGARLEQQGLLRLIGLRQRAEIDHQWRAIQILRLDLHIAVDEMTAKRISSVFDRVIRARLEARLKEAKAHCWPSQAEMYSVIRLAALEELRAPNHCRVCDGRGRMVVGDLSVDCLQCEGSGTAPASGRGRAERLGTSETNYRREWKAPYEWTYALVSNAEANGAYALAAALAR
jgi:hypothetical protein